MWLLHVSMRREESNAMVKAIPGAIAIVGVPDFMGLTILQVDEFVQRKGHPLPLNSIDTQLGTIPREVPKNQGRWEYVIMFS